MSCVSFPTYPTLISCGLRLMIYERRGELEHSDSNAFSSQLILLASYLDSKGNTWLFAVRRRDTTSLMRFPTRGLFSCPGGETAEKN